MPWAHVPCAAGSPLSSSWGASPSCLLSRQGRTEELKRLAAELMEVFSVQEVHREATAALVLFQRASEEEQVTVELISRLSALLRRKG